MSQTETVVKETGALMPYEKFVRYGAQALSDEELLAVIIRTGMAGKDALSLAGEVLRLCGKNRGLTGLYHLELKELMSIEGIGQVKAVKIKCIAELSRRIAKQRVRPTDTLNGPSAIAAYFMEDMRHLEYEKCIAVYLDSKCHILSEITLATGSVSHAQLPVRELFKNAFSVNASQIILLHNHPSGDPAPSGDDIRITERIARAAAMLELNLADHIIIGDHTYISFREQGIMKSN